MSSPPTDPMPTTFLPLSKIRLQTRAYIHSSFFPTTKSKHPPRPGQRHKHILTSSLSSYNKIKDPAAATTTIPVQAYSHLLSCFQNHSRARENNVTAVAAPPTNMLAASQARADSTAAPTTGTNGARKNITIHSSHFSHSLSDKASRNEIRFPVNSPPPLSESPFLEADLSILPETPLCISKIP